MKIDRPTYTIKEALQLIADTKHPIPPRDKRTRLVARNRWFGPDVLAGSFSPVWFDDYDGRFLPETVGGPFVPVSPGSPGGETPGELVGMEYASAEEYFNKWAKQTATLRLDRLIRAGAIRPQTALGMFVLGEWDDYALHFRDVDRLVLTADDFRKLCAEIPIEIEESPQPIVRDGKQMKRQALIAAHIGKWPTIDRDLSDAADNGLRAVAKSDKHGMWYVSAALEWATAQGKLVEPSTTAMPLRPSKVHRIR